MSLRRLATTLVLALAVIASCAAEGRAQSPERGDPRSRTGFWASVGLGPGLATTTCDVCDSDWWTGLSGGLRAGMALTQHLLVGVSANGWWKRESGMDKTIVALSGIIVLYPSARSGFHFQAGAGYQHYFAEFCFLSCETNPRETATQSGPGFSAGAGFDLSLGPRFSLTPHVNYLFTVGGRTYMQGFPVADLNTNLVLIGLAATLH